MGLLLPKFAKFPPKMPVLASISTGSGIQEKDKFLAKIRPTLASFPTRREMKLYNQQPEAGQGDWRA